MNNKDNEIKKYENKINEINDEIDDVIENFKFMLIHNDIKDINTLNFHYEIQDLLHKKDQLTNILFNLKY